MPRSVRATGVVRAATGGRQAAEGGGQRLRRTEDDHGHVVTVGRRPVDPAVAGVDDVHRRGLLVVSGTPAYAGTAEAALTPGTTSKGMPALWQASASSAQPLNVAGVAVHEAHDEPAGRAPSRP